MRITSALNRPNNVSVRALPYESLMLSTEGSMPASARAELLRQIFVHLKYLEE